MTITKTSHRLCEMVVSLGSQGTLVTGTKTEPVIVAQYRRCLLCTCVSSIDEITHVHFTRVSANLGFVTGIKQQLLPQLSPIMWNGCFSGSTGNFCNGHENRACYCEINIRDVCREPASPLSRWNETQCMQCKIQGCLYIMLHMPC
jgi:hypothetical protein